MNHAPRDPWEQANRLHVARGCAARDDKPGVFEALGYAPAFPAQQALHESRAPRRVVRFGRRGGKTLAAAVELVYLLLQPGKRAWVVAPTHDLTERIWREVCRLLFDVLGLESESRRETAPRELRLPGGSHLAGKSTTGAAQASLVGDSLDGLVWDECALSPGSVWETRLQPNLADHNGWALFTSTPEGYNHFYDKWRLTETDPDWEGFYAPSWENPYLPARTIEEARRQFTPEVFAQAYEAKFTQLAGRVYPEFDEAWHVAQVAFDPDLPLHVTFDFGTTEDSPFACLWLQETAENVIHVLRELVVANRSTAECGELVAAEHEQVAYPRATWATGDPAARDGRLVLEQVCKSVLPPQSIVWQQHTLEAGIEAIRQRLRPLEARRSGVSPDPSLCHPERSEGSVGWQPVPAAGGSRYAAGTPVPATSDGGVGPVGRGLCPAPIAEGAGDTEPGLRQLLRVRSRLLIDPACATLIREFNLYRRREHQEGTDLQPRPIKEHDHCLDALRYYVMGGPLKRPKETTRRHSVASPRGRGRAPQGRGGR